ncbi:MAG: hypothetical protein V4538_16170 [Bacteroidota bacterium]
MTSEQIILDLKEGKKVSMWDVLQNKNELRRLVKHTDNINLELDIESLIDFAKESL